jgi:hypothetical protein
MIEDKGVLVGPEYGLVDELIEDLGVDLCEGTLLIVEDFWKEEVRQLNVAHV